MSIKVQEIKAIWAKHPEYIPPKYPAGLYRGEWYITVEDTDKKGPLSVITFVSGFGDVCMAVAKKCVPRAFMSASDGMYYLINEEKNHEVLQTVSCPAVASKTDKENFVIDELAPLLNNYKPKKGKKVVPSPIEEEEEEGAP